MPSCMLGYVDFGVRGKFRGFNSLKMIIDLAPHATQVLLLMGPEACLLSSAASDSHELAFKQWLKRQEIQRSWQSTGMPSEEFASG